MQDGQASRTALMTAVFRARESLTAPEPKILDDRLALPLSGLPDIAAVEGFIDGITAQFAALSDEPTARELVALTGEIVCLRARLVAETYTLLSREGLEQVIVLGAGLDSMAYSMGSDAPHIQFIEVDHPATQAWKRECLAQAEIEIPPNMRFVSFDFEKQTLMEALEAGGVDRSKLTLFSWLGVLMYLSDDAISSTLDVLGKFAPGSTVVLDFLKPDYDDLETLAPGGVPKMKEILAEMGEPLLSLFTLPELEDRFKGAGFTDISFPTAGTLIHQFMGAPQSRLLTPDAMQSYVVARI